jgi:Zn-dependent protease with chaperone function
LEDKTATNQICPNCGSELTADKGFRPWCENCEWNLTFSETAKPRNLFEAFYSSISRKHGESLFNSLVKSNPERLRPTFTFSKFAAFAIAIFVHLSTFFLAILGIALLFIGRTNFFAILGAVICVLIAWVTRPRFAGFPKNTVSRQDFPVLYELVDSVAKSLGAKCVDGIVINGDFNAAFGQVGLANKKILYIGLSLWTILSKQEKIALISHELSHGINGDPIRGVFVVTAIKSLIIWHSLLKPNKFWEPENGFLGILIFPLNISLHFLSYIPWLGAYALSYLLWMNSQKAEYLADYLATKVCGTTSMLDLLEKNQMGNRFKLILHKVSLRDEKRDLFKEFRQDILSLPPGEKERIRRIGKLEKSRLDATHPPTVFRAEFLKNHSEKNMTFSLTQEKAEQIDEEIFKIQSKIQTDITDKYKAALYY